MTMVRYPLPITNAMLAPANQNIMKPRYDANWTSDWHGAQFGNEEDQAEATQAIANSCSARVETDYDPQHQKAKASDMVPPLQILDDLGKDYGIYAGGAGRTGYVTPQQPYPDATSPPTVTNVSPASGWDCWRHRHHHHRLRLHRRHRRDGRRHRRDGGRRRQQLHHHRRPRRRTPQAPSIPASPRRKAKARSPPPPITSSTCRLVMSSGLRPNEQMHLPGLGVPIDPWTGDLLSPVKLARIRRLQDAEGVVRQILHELDGTSPGSRARRSPHGDGFHQT